MRLSDIIRHVKGIFETKRKNPVLLENDSNLESRLKFLRVAKSNTPIQISDDTVNIQGSLNVNGASVQTGDEVGAITALNNATENRLVTVSDTITELDADPTLFYASNSLEIVGADSTIGIIAPTDADGYDLDIHAGNANGSNNGGGDLYLRAGRSTGNQAGGYIYFTSSYAGGAGSTLRGEAIVGRLGGLGTFRVTAGDGSAGKFVCYNSNTTTEHATLEAGGLSSGQALSVDGGAGTVTIDDDGLTYATFTSSDSSFKLHEAGQDAGVDYFKIACSTSGASTISTNDAFAAAANLTINPDGQLILDSNGVLGGAAIKCESNLIIKESANAVVDTAGYGQIWVDTATPNVLMFTDDAGNDNIVSPYIQTAVFGGGLGRATGLDDTWLGIPVTGHQYTVPQFGTTASAPDTTYSPSTTADDLLSCIWQPATDIQVLSCKLRFAQGGGTNTTHIGCLMKYRIDADGDLTTGEVVGVVETESTSADYSHLVSLDLTITAGNATTDIGTYNHIFIAMVYCPDGINSQMTAQCTLGYKNIIV